MQQAGPVRLYGKRGSPQAYAIRDFLQRSDVPFEWVELANHEQARDELGLEERGRFAPAGLHLSRRDPHGAAHRAPSYREARLVPPSVALRIRRRHLWRRAGRLERLGLRCLRGLEDGPRRTLRRRRPGRHQPEDRELSRVSPKGSAVPNLPSGHASKPHKFGAEILIHRAGVRGEFSTCKGVVDLDDGTRIVSRVSVCATGVEYRRLGLPDEDRLFGAGVYYGAGASEAQLCGNEHVVMVGAGNSSAQASLHLARYARKVTIVMRGERLNDNVSEYLVDRVTHMPEYRNPAEEQSRRLAWRRHVACSHHPQSRDRRGAHDRDELPVSLSRRGSEYPMGQGGRHRSRRARLSRHRA